MMIEYNESTGIYVKEWDTSHGMLKFDADFKTGQIHVFLKNRTKTSEIPLSSLNGIPKEAFNDIKKLSAFLNKSYAKVAIYDDGSYNIQINPRLLGGGNTINPNAEPERLWPGAHVPYVINFGDDRGAIVERAIKAWNDANTGFLLAPAKKDRSNNPVDKDYIIFGWDERLSCSTEQIESKKCSVCESYVGRKGGPQQINCNLSEDFDEGSVMHEIGHALGLYHEQQREDRDKFVTVSTDGKLDSANYGKQGKISGSYDFKSIMHYPFFVFPKKMAVVGYDHKAKAEIIDEVEDYENPQMRINHNLSAEQYDQIINLNSMQNEYGKSQIPSEELKDKHRHLIANNPYSLYQLESGVLSVGNQRQISNGDRVAASHLASLGIQLNSLQSQQCGNNTSQSYRRRK